MANFELVGVQAVVEGLDSFSDASSEIVRHLQDISVETLKLDRDSRGAWTAITAASEDFFIAFAAGAAGIASAGLGIVASVETIGAKFNETLAGARVDISTTDADMQQLGATVLDAGSKFGIGLNQLGAATAQLRQAGITLADINAGALKATTDLAVATGGGPQSLAAAVQTTAEVMHVFNINGNDMQQAANLIAGAVDNSTINLTAFGSIIAQLGPTANELGFSFRDVATVIGEMGKSGQSAFTIANSLNQAFARLANPTKETLGIMKELGLSIQDTNGNIVDLRTFVDRLSSAFEGTTASGLKLTAAQRQQDLEALFGARAVRGLVTVIQDGTAGFDAMAKTLDNTNVEKVANQFQESLSPQLEITRNLLQTLIIQGSEPLAVSLTVLATNVNNFLRSLDPAIPKAFGDAIASIVTGQQAKGLQSALEGILGTGAGDAINGMIEAARNATNVISGELVPAVIALGKAFFDAFGGTTSVSATFAALSATFRVVITDVVAVIDVLTGIATALKGSRDAADLFHIALDAFLALPVLGFVALILSLGSAFVTILGPILLIAAAVGGLIVIGGRLAATFDGSIASILAGLSALGTVETIVAAITLGLSLRIGVDLVEALFASTAGFRTVAAAAFEFAVTLIGQVDIALTATTAALFDMAAAAVTAILAFDFGAAIAAIIALGPVIVVAAALVAAFASAVNANLFGMGDAFREFLRQATIVFNGTIEGFQFIIDKIIELARLVHINLGSGGAVENDYNDMAGAVGTNATKSVGFMGEMEAELQRLQAQGHTSTQGVAADFAAMQAEIARQSEAFVQTLQTDTNAYNQFLRFTSTRPNTESTATSAPSVPGFPDLLSSGSTAAPKLAAIEDEVRKLISDIPGASDALAKFLAQLEQADPGRLGGLVAGLESAKGIIDAMVVSAANLNAIDQQIATTQASINDLQAQAATIDLQTAVAEIGLNESILALKTQIAQQDLQAAEIEQSILPVQQQIASITEQIQVAQQENYGLAQQIANVALQELPIKQQIAALEQQITDSVNQRQVLTQQAAVVTAQGNVRDIQDQIATTKDALDAAWQTNNIPAVLAAQAQLTILDNQLVGANEVLRQAQQAQDQTNEQNQLTAINIKLQEQNYQDLLTPLQAQLTILQNQQDLSKATSAVIVAGLEAQRQALQNQIQPMVDQLNAIKANTDVLKAQLQVQDDQKTLIDDAAAARKLHIDEALAQDKLQLDSLKALQTAEGNRLAALAQGFIEALVNSKAYTLGEAEETLKRLSFIDSENTKWIQQATDVENVKAAVDALTNTLATMPKDYTITIHLKTEGSIPSFAEGGTVPGPLGSPQLIVAHGGEQFLGVGSTAPSNVSSASVGTPTPSKQPTQNITNATYNVNANYAQVQSPATIAMDLRAIAASTRR